MDGRRCRVGCGAIPPRELQLLTPRSKFSTTRDDLNVCVTTLAGEEAQIMTDIEIRSVGMCCAPFDLHALIATVTEKESGSETSILCLPMTMLSIAVEPRALSGG